MTNIFCVDVEQDDMIIYHIRDMSTDQYFYIPDHEDFKYWYAYAYDYESDYMQGYDGDCKRFPGLHLGSQILLAGLDGNVNHFRFVEVVGRLECHVSYFQRLIDENNKDNPVAITFLPSHDEKNRPDSEKAIEIPIIDWSSFENEAKKEEASHD